jgi:hypothetical protein
VKLSKGAVQLSRLQFPAEASQSHVGQPFRGLPSCDQRQSRQDDPRHHQELAYTHRWTQLSIEELAETFNPVLRGWIGYYGQFYKSKLASVLGQFDYALRRWARRKFKRRKAGPTRAGAWLRRVARQKPDLFAHWAITFAGMAER